MGDITIKNKLSVKSGNKVLVPGCEPVSGTSSTTILQNLDCLTSEVDLADALAAIPGSTVEMILNPKQLLFVLPSGPPTAAGCTGCETTDWYKLLRGIGQPSATETSETGCDAFQWSGCTLDKAFGGEA